MNARTPTVFYPRRVFKVMRRLRAEGHSASHRRKWLNAVRYLRTQSQRGWVLDATDFPTRKDFA